MLDKIYKSASLWLLAWNLIWSVGLATALAGWDNGFYRTRFTTFALSFGWLVVAPRVTGVCLGSWGVSGGRRTGRPVVLPRGAWIMFGNPWPEYAIVFYDDYPTVAGKCVESIHYRQTATLYGMLMFPRTTSMVRENFDNTRSHKLVPPSGN